VLNIVLNFKRISFTSMRSDWSWTREMPRSLYSRLKYVGTFVHSGDGFFIVRTPI